MPRKKVEQPARHVMTVEIVGPAGEISRGISAATGVLQQCAPNCKIRVSHIPDVVEPAKVPHAG